MPREASQWAFRCQKVPERLIALIMALYSNARARVRTPASTSWDLGYKSMGVHQGSALSLLLFVLVMQEATRAARGEGLWDLFYAKDLAITAESGKEAVRKFGLWKRETETGGLKVNLNKIKLMVMGREPAVRPKRGRYRCGVCGKGVGGNAIWCQCCETWH